MDNKLIVVTPDCSVKKVALLMEQYGIGGFPVIDNDELVGIITSRDVKRSHPNRLVADAMSKDVITVKDECFTWEAKEIMQENKIKRLLTLKDGKPYRMLTKVSVYNELGKQTDSLTGLYKSPYLWYKAKQFWQQEKQISIIFLDLNDFGLINKKFGHVVGDKILKKTAIILNSEIDKELDGICRYGGDEFAIITGRNIKHAEQFAWKIIDDFDCEVWDFSVKVAVSIGVANWKQPYDQVKTGELDAIDNLINIASKASTKAKTNNLKVFVHCNECY